MQHWTRFDLELPDDFPVGAADSLHAYLSDRRQDQNQTVEWKEWATGLNGCVYRFLACDEAARAAIASLQGSDSPPQPERFLQERELFGFYFQGFSSLECTCYALYFVGALADPNVFTPSVNRKTVTPSFVTSRYASAFPAERLSTALDAVTSSPEFRDLGNIRNFLSHRGAPGRTFYEGGGPPSGVDWNLPIPQVDTARELEPANLQGRRSWLGDSLTNMFGAADEFARRHVP